MWENSKVSERVRPTSVPPLYVPLHQAEFREEAASAIAGGGGGGGGSSGRSVTCGPWKTSQSCVQQ